MKKIKLTQGKFALVDDEDFDFLNQWNWYAHKERKRFYAISWIESKKAKMHRILLGLTDAKVQCDHKDGNGLNNQRNNLREATSSQQGMNKIKKGNTKSKYKGIAWRNDRNTWKARIGKKDLGCFKTEEEAALAYNNAAKICFGEFAKLNQVG